jgi:hypothetical protein
LHVHAGTTAPHMGNIKHIQFLQPDHATAAAAAPQLKTKIARALAAREQKQRKRNLAKYIPNCCDALWQVLAKMAAQQPGGPKRRRLEDRHGVLQKVGRAEAVVPCCHGTMLPWCLLACCCAR